MDNQDGMYSSTMVTVSSSSMFHKSSTITTTKSKNLCADEADTDADADEADTDDDATQQEMSSYRSNRRRRQRRENVAVHHRWHHPFHCYHGGIFGGISMTLVLLLLLLCSDDRNYNTGTSTTILVSAFFTPSPSSSSATTTLTQNRRSSASVTISTGRRRTGQGNNKIPLFEGRICLPILRATSTATTATTITSSDAAVSASIIEEVEEKGTTEKVAVAVAATGKVLNTTAPTFVIQGIESDITIPLKKEHDDEEKETEKFSSSFSSSLSSPMKLIRTGNRLEVVSVSRNNDEGHEQGDEEQDITLLDGLATDVWTSVRPTALAPTTVATNNARDNKNDNKKNNSSSSSSSSSFSSMVLQTPVPTTNSIKSYPLGNLLPIKSKAPSSLSSSSSTTTERSAHQNHQYPHQWLAAARLNRYWMGPKFGGNDENTKNKNDNAIIPVDTQFFLIELQRCSTSSSKSSLPPYYVLMMPLVDNGYRSTLESSSLTIDNDAIIVGGHGGGFHKSKGNKKKKRDQQNEQEQEQQLTLLSYSESGDVRFQQELELQGQKKENQHESATQMMNALYVAIHDDPYELVSKGFQEVSNNVLNQSFLTLDQKHLPYEFVNKFGWCTWDAYYSKVSPRGILKGIESFSNAGIPVKNIILDDGWQSVSPLQQQDDNNDSNDDDDDSSNNDNESNNNSKKQQQKPTIASSLSLTGSSDIMPSTSSSLENKKRIDDSSSLLDTVGRYLSGIASRIKSSVSTNHQLLPTVVAGISSAPFDVKTDVSLAGAAKVASAVAPATAVIAKISAQNVVDTPTPTMISEATTAAVTTIINKKNNPIQLLRDSVTAIGASMFTVVAEQIAAIYQYSVVKSSYDSIPHRTWTLLARNFLPLNAGLWSFFDTETDFGRQLNDFEPNWKFRKRGPTTNTVTADNDGSTNNANNTNFCKNMDLKDLVSTLKDDWNVNRVYCWHSLHGYWRGASNELGRSIGIDVTQIKTRPSDHLLRIEPEMAYDPPSLFGVGLIRDPANIRKFYKNLHAPLVEAGVDGVKIDVQSGVSASGISSTLNGKDGGVSFGKLYTEAMEESVSKRFSKSSTSNAVGANDANTAVALECINCMCHSTENLYRYRSTSIARASDDFYPARPESHTVHLVNVAYNSLFVGEICLPDWDMFHSKHKSSQLHAAARAIGGTPVYVSDKPGNHDIDLLKTLVLPDGSVLRADKPGRPTRDCLFADVGRDGVSALKVWNVNNHNSSVLSGAGGGVIGAFNVQGVAWNFDTNENEILNTSPPDVTASIKPYDINSLIRKEHDYYNDDGGPSSFAVWSHRTKSLQVLPTGDSSIETILKPHEWEIYTIQPIQQHRGDSNTKIANIQWAPIGLMNMLNSGGALTNAGTFYEDTNVFDSDDVDTTASVNISCRGPGSFVAYCQPRPLQIFIRNNIDQKYDDSSTRQLSTQQRELNFQYSNGMLEFNLPPESMEGTAHDLTVVWQQ